MRVHACTHARRRTHLVRTQGNARTSLDHQCTVPNCIALNACAGVCVRVRARACACVMNEHACAHTNREYNTFSACAYASSARRVRAAEGVYETRTCARALARFAAPKPQQIMQLSQAWRTALSAPSGSAPRSTTLQSARAR